MENNLISNIVNMIGEHADVQMENITSILSGLNAEYSVLNRRYPPLKSKEYIEPLSHTRIFIKKNLVRSEINFTMNDYNSDDWIHDHDFSNHGDLTTDDRLVRTIEITNFYDKINSIMEGVADSDDDDNFTNYQIVVAEEVQFLINKMIDDQEWTFIPMEKITWIYLMIAARHESRALKYIKKSEFYSPRLLVEFDRLGNSPLILLCKHGDEKTLELFIDDIDLASLTMKNSKSVSPLLYACQSTGVFLLLLKKFGDELANTAALYYGCNHNGAIIPPILDAKIDQGTFQKVVNVEGAEMTCLMLAAMHQPKVLNNLLDHPLMDEEFANFSDSRYGNFLSVLIRFNPAHFHEIADSRYISEKMLCDANVNTIFEAIKYPAILKKILDNKNFNKENLKLKINDETCLFNAIRENRESLKILLNYVPKEVFRMKNRDGCTPFMYAALHPTSTGYDFINSKNFDYGSIYETDETGCNFIMNLLSMNLNKKEMIADLLDDTLLHQKDMDGLSTLIYICHFAPSLVLERRVISDESLQDNDLFIYSKNEKLVEKLIDVNVFENNLLLNISRYNGEILSLLLKSDKLKKVHLKCVDKKKYNCFLYSICFSDVSTVEKIIKNEYFGYEVMNQITSNNKNAFILASNRNPEFVDLILKSDFFETGLLSERGLNGKTCLMEVIHFNNPGIIRLLLDKITEEIFMGEDDDGNNILFYAIKYSDSNMISLILENSWMTHEIYENTLKKYIREYGFSTKLVIAIHNCPMTSEKIFEFYDGGGQTILTHSIIHNPILAENILHSPFFSKSALEHRDVKGRNCLFFINKINRKIITTIVNHRFFDEEMLLCESDQNRTPLSIYLDNEMYEEVQLILEKTTKRILVSYYNGVNNLISSMCYFNLVESIINLPYMDKEILRVSDTDGNTCLHHIVNKHASAPSGAYRELKLILESEHCTPELLETKNSDGTTFLLMGPEHTEQVINSEHFTRRLMIDQRHSGVNLLSMIIGRKPEILGNFLNHKFICEEIFLTDTTIIPLMVAVEIDNGSLATILNSTICSDKIVNHKSKNGHTALSYAILNDKIEAVDLLLNSRYDLSASFKTKDNDNRNVLIMTSTVSFEIFKRIIGSKYVDEEMLFMSDNYGHNLVTYVFSNNLQMVKYLVGSAYWDERLQLHTDIDDDSLLIYPFNKPEIVEYIANLDNVNPKMFTFRNRVGYNIAHMYAEKNPETLQKLIEGKNFDPKLLLETDIYGRTPFQIECQFGIDILLNSRYFDKLWLNSQDNYGRNPLMIAIEYDSDSTERMIELSNHTVFDQTDYKGDTVVFYATRYNTKLLKKIMDLDSFNPTMLDNRNKAMETAIMYGCRYNAQSVKHLLDISKDSQLSFNHTDYGSALTIAARYQPLAVKYILDKQGLPWRIINTNDKDGMDFLRIGAQYNPEVVKYAIESGYDVAHFLEMFIHNEPAIFLATKYQPMALKYILDSKYAHSKMLKIKHNGRRCIDEAFDFQPKSLLFIIESEIINDTILNLEDEIGYKLINKLKKIYPELNSVEDIKKNKLVEYDNIWCDDDTECCNICYSFRSRVIFYPCHHTSCVGCAFKLMHCHICRKLIDDKILFKN